MGHLTVSRGADGSFYARTEHTSGWVRLPSSVHELASHYDLEPEDLNLELGPLGRLS